MEPATLPADPLGQTSKRFARRLLTIGENRCQLLMLEVQQERERLLHALLLALGIAALGLLAAGAFTGAIVVLFWEVSRLTALLVLAGLYGAGAGFLYWRLMGVLRDWQSLPATLEQLGKDRAWLEESLR